MDYTNIFFQVPLKQTVFVELPRGFEYPNKVLLLIQLVYGLRQSPLIFYKHLRQGIESRGFRKTDHDDCIFTKGTVIILFWVDDCILYSKHKREIEDLIVNLKDACLLEKESDITGFLVISTDRGTEGKVILKQTGLQPCLCQDKILSISADR